MKVEELVAMKVTKAMKALEVVECIPFRSA